jgi:hypothetical protein
MISSHFDFENGGSGRISPLTSIFPFGGVATLPRAVGVDGQALWVVYCKYT